MGHEQQETIICDLFQCIILLEKFPSSNDLAQKNTSHEANMIYIFLWLALRVFSFISTAVRLT